jgi:hypothetical protein
MAFGRLEWHLQTLILIAVATLTVSLIAAQMFVSTRFDPDDFMGEPGGEFGRVGTVFSALALCGAAPALVAFFIASLSPESRICQAVAALLPNVVFTVVAYPHVGWATSSYSAPIVLMGLGVLFFGLALLGRPDLWLTASPAPTDANEGDLANRRRMGRSFRHPPSNRMDA